eukprot:5857905-Pleurochrysis_carterae.AAC.10
MFTLAQSVRLVGHASGGGFRPKCVVGGPNQADVCKVAQIQSLLHVGGAITGTLGWVAPMWSQRLVRHAEVYADLADCRQRRARGGDGGLGRRRP